MTDSELKELIVKYKQKYPNEPDPSNGGLRPFIDYLYILREAKGRKIRYVYPKGVKTNIPDVIYED